MRGRPTVTNLLLPTYCYRPTAINLLLPTYCYRPTNYRPTLLLPTSYSLPYSGLRVGRVEGEQRRREYDGHSVVEHALAEDHREEVVLDAQRLRSGRWKRWKRWKRWQRWK